MITYWILTEHFNAYLYSQQSSYLSCVTVLCHVNHPRSIREEHLIKEHCGLSGIMGYVTFHHKTGRGLSKLSFYMRNNCCHVSHN